MKAASAASLRPSLPPDYITATLQCAGHRAVVVSYSNARLNHFWATPAIDGSVYGCIAEHNHYIATPCCEDAAPKYLLKRSPKEMKFVVTSPGITVICAKVCETATREPCRVLPQSSGRRYSWTPAGGPPQLPRGNAVDSSGFGQCADVL